MAAAPAHVLMTADALGGVWTYAIDLAAGLAGRGVAVTLAVLGPPPSAGQRRAAGACGVRLVETGLPLDWLADGPAAIAEAARRLSALAGAADLVHLNSPAFAADAAFGAPVVGVCHSCVATWWDAAGEGAPPPDFAWRTALLSRGYDACDALIAPTAAFARATRRRYGVAPVVVRNGLAARETPAAPGDRAAVVLTSGRLWDRGKNVAALDLAAGQMRGRVQGAGPLEGPAGERVRLAAIAPLGQLEREAVARRLGGARVFASLALYEPFGLGVLEAAQAGCALALSDIPTFRELWDGAAVFVDPGDPAAVARTLDGLLDDPDHAAWLGALAAARAARFTLDAMVDGVLSLYDQVLRRRMLRRGAAA
jgi:glycosyltransferase involved in cell wall biosynthesis